MQFLLAIYGIENFWVKCFQVGRATTHFKLFKLDVRTNLRRNVHIKADFNLKSYNLHSIAKAMIEIPI